MSVECGPRACNFILPLRYPVLADKPYPTLPPRRSSSLLHTRLLPLSCLYLSLSIFTLKATLHLSPSPHPTISLLDRFQRNSIKRGARNALSAPSKNRLGTRARSAYAHAVPII